MIDKPIKRAVESAINKSRIDRRDFIKTLGSISLASLASGFAPSSVPAEAKALNYRSGQLDKDARTNHARAAGKRQLSLNDKGYFSMPGLDVIVFDDFYPEGHQSGVTIIQQGVRVAANGDLRLEPSPGQWSPVPKKGRRLIDRAANTITQCASYPDESKNRKGFNPIVYPDLKFSYSVSVKPVGRDRFRIRVDLDKPLPNAFVGNVGFNLELFPGDLFGKSWLMDGHSGVFAPQPSGPMRSTEGGPVVDVLAHGAQLTIAPGSDAQRMTITSDNSTLQLWDGRSNHANGWYIVRGVVPAGASKGAIKWTVSPHVIKGWKYNPVLQVSQLGYAPAQPKRLVIEQDSRDHQADPVTLYRLTDNGREQALQGEPEQWGDFLRYHYLTFDFSTVHRQGVYQFAYRDEVSHPFRIAAEVYRRGAWQPTLEYFLPIQMCHMRVEENSRVWHGLCHQDDARMAPVDIDHFDGYTQGPSTLTKYKPGQHVPDLDAGGWHDAGDFDLRIESQIGTVWRLAKMIEEFNLNHDATTIDESRKLVKIHQPDGRNDAIQQIKHGLLTVLGGYHALGRTYRGIIVPTLDQYRHLGEASTQTDNIPMKRVPGLGTDHNGHPITADDRWVFTEDNPPRELGTAAGLATAARVLRETDPELAGRSLATAHDLFIRAIDRTDEIGPRVFALSELICTTSDRKLIARLVALKPQIVAHIDKTGWALAEALPQIHDAGFLVEVRNAVAAYQRGLRQAEKTNSPYGVPYKPNIWGAGWDIQDFGVKQYFFAKGWPDLVDKRSMLHALEFVLGVHPGQNNASFASGVGARSTTVAYGFNRATWTYIPGGSVSGTALIRPDLPELKVWPYFWQQTEYVMGGGATNYMFLVMAADSMFRDKTSK